MIPIRVLLPAVAGVALLGTPARLVARTDNGNEFALAFTRAVPAQQKTLREEALGKPFFFRYVALTTVETITTNGFEGIRMAGTEPSSDMTVQFVITKPVSLKAVKEANLKVGEAVAVTGTLRALDPAGRRIVLDPVIFRYKDKAAPVAGKELLYELNPKARVGTDTSSGKEVVHRKTDK